MGYAIVKTPPTPPHPSTEPPPPPAPPPPDVLVRTISDWSLSPVELYVRKHYEMYRTGHFDCIYPDWRVRRIRKVVQLYGTDWKGKRIVELGGGLGDIGAFFAELGAEVFSVEGRQENVDLANIKYHRIPTFMSIQRDLEQPFDDLGRFDLVLSLGSLEVIENIDGYIKSCSALSDKIVLESFVLNSDDERLSKLAVGSPDTNDQTLYGRAVSPSYGYVERAFRDSGFKVERHNEGLDSAIECYGPQEKAAGTRFFWSLLRDVTDLR